MSSTDYVLIGVAIFGVFTTIIGALIVWKVTRMDEDITKLQDAHVVDVAALNDLKLKVSEAHPTKNELKDMLNKFKEYLDERFNNVEQIARYSGSLNEPTRRNPPRDSEK